jgi:hypothetical protein
MSAPDLVILVAAGGFLVMGLGALIAPALVTRQFDMPDPTHAGRSEIRAVYGGFGVVMAAMLVVALVDPVLRAGICLTLAAALAGMAGGRVVSLAWDRRIGRRPALYLVLELVFAALLYGAA